MKARILIVENDYAQFFVAKQLIEIQLNLQVTTVDLAESSDVEDAASIHDPSEIICFPQGGATELYLKLKKRRLNRRNAEVILMSADNLSEEKGRRVEQYFAEFSRLGRSGDGRRGYARVA